MKPKLKRKKYALAGGVTNPYETQAFVTDEYGNQIATNTETGAALKASQTNTLSGIGTEGVGSAVPSTSANASSGNAMGSILSMAGGTALSGMSSGKNKNSAIQSAYKTPLYRAADVAMPGLGIGLQVADVGINAASKGIANQFSDQTTMGRAVKKGQKWSEWGVDPSTKMMLGEIGAGVSLLTDKKQKQKLQREESDKAQAQKDYLSMQQQFGDQTIGTQQTNPVYGMKNGGSLYEMGGNVKKKSFNGIIHSDKNGVDKTEASMPEGTFVVDADHLKQAVKHGVIEPQKVSPHQGGVPIMITGGKVAPEGVISPDKVKQLLAMGVDLDKYAPNADTSIYDLAGTRKNVMHGGNLQYAKGGYLSPKGYAAIDYFEDTKGNRAGKSMNKGAGYSRGLSGDSDQTVTELENYIDTHIGKANWDKLPENIKIQMYNIGFNNKPENMLKGVAQAIDPSKTDRSKISEQDALALLQNADFSKGDIQERYIEQVVPNQYLSIGQNNNKMDAYENSWKNRASEINAFYQNQLANPNAPMTRVDSNKNVINYGLNSTASNPPVNPPVNPPQDNSSNNLWNLGSNEPSYKIENPETNPVTPNTPSITDPIIDISQYSNKPQNPPVNPPSNPENNSKTPMTDEEKLRAAQYGMLGLEGAVQIGSGLWNLSRQRTPVPKPQRFISTPYTPNVSAMDALQQASQDKALATALYNIRQSGGGSENFNAMHANELENDLSYNAQRTGITEGARQANTTLENQDRANYTKSLYDYGVGEAQAKDAFRAAKGEAVTKNIENLMALGTQAVGVKKSQLDENKDIFTNQYFNANSLAPGLSHSSFTPGDYRKNQTAYDKAQSTLLGLRNKNTPKYDEIAPKIKTMNPIDAATFMQGQL